MESAKDRKPFLSPEEEAEIRAGVREIFEGYYMAPNNEETWEALRESIIQLLSHLWETGKLHSPKNEGFQVHLSLGSTMSRQDVEQGKVKVNISFGNSGEYTRITL
ncbi:MAG: hypothetical protein H6581_28580 [Bacteroidia bacterium]|nr:hypothetical protein [Bacteroidia bacterium]